MSTQPLLQVQSLRTYFFTPGGVVQAVDGIDFTLMPGETLGIVGESGSGKSVTSLSIMRLVSDPGEIVEGHILFNGIDLVSLDEETMRTYRGNRISMIFQQPTSCLNPVYTVGNQIIEALQIHQNMDAATAKARAIELLQLVRLPDAAQRMNSYPHEISGGQAQRIMIAMALACNPVLLIADEPTTALDVTIQAQILELMRDLRTRINTAIMLITHDLGVIAEMADRVVVMYAGQIVESATVHQLFEAPLHPYSRALLDSMPVLGEQTQTLAVIEGTVPSMVTPPDGCRFAERCHKRFARCDSAPPLIMHQDRQVRCWLYATEGA
ncbi:MAG: ABC transporter ATP-binding protein [Roseiflexaceae bacterium]|jgi:peptide/nickel transport system ATP-binding protein|nr:ABC transporter ATP-binding protein [Chloroflexaceae bacterium]MCE2851271.1 ABC transporter ATP-binding protein [Chloroflexaceae bacterium]